MEEKQSKSWTERIPYAIVIVCRFLLGAVFVFSGVVKGIDPTGTAIKIGEYAAFAGITLGTSLSMVLSQLLCLVEFALGFLLLTGIWHRFTAWAMLLMMSALTLLTAYIAIANPVKDCGCFGDAIHISNSATFWKNVVLLVLAILVFLGRGRKAFLRIFRSAQWNTVVAIVAMLVFWDFMHYNVKHLPPIDFRPYKLGVSIPELKGMGETELRQDEYDYKYVYEKDGVEMTFNLEELEQIDSTWTFVRDASVLISKGDVARATDFVIIDAMGNDITSDLLAPTARVMLLMTPDVMELSAEDADLYNLLHSTALSKGGTLHMVMSNGHTEEVMEHVEKLNPNYYIDYLDETTTKTVIRSNPGLVIMEGGEILRKASYADIKTLVKSEEFLDNPFVPVSKSELKKSQMSHWGRLSLVGLIYLVILVKTLGQRLFRSEVEESKMEEEENYRVHY